MEAISIPHSRLLQTNDRIDLHVHTIYSDGHWTPEGLCDYLASEHYALVSVTDHDRVDHVGEMQQLGIERGIAVLSGVEVTTDWHGQIAHLLCYGFTTDCGALSEIVTRTVRLQKENIEKVHQTLLQRGFAFPRRREIFSRTHGELERPIDNATLLVEHGYVADIQTGIAVIADAGFTSITASLADAVAAAHEDGGVALIAHPGRQDTSFGHFDVAALATMVSEGIALDGIEVYYPSHTVEQVQAYEALVHERHMLASSGSDSHGPRQRFPVAYRAELSWDLLIRCGLSVAGILSQTKPVKEV